jgi:hypothetical protein
MPTFKCDTCNYKTDRAYDLTKHNSTKKHIKNLELSITERDKCGIDKKNEHRNKNELLSDTSDIESCDDYLHVCKFCGDEFKHERSKLRHEKTRCKNKSSGETNEVVRLLTKQVEQLAEQNKNFFELIKDNTNLANKSMSTTSYVIKHFDKAPPIKKLKNTEAIKLLEYDVPENHTSGDMIIFKYASKKLNKYLGDIIVRTYKTDNPADQSFWNSDSARLSFIVRQVLKSGDNEWITDKSGIKLTNLIISPMLDNVKIIMQNYVLEKGEALDKSKGNLQDVNTLENMEHANSIILMISNKSLHKDILRCISPHFNLDIRKVDLLKL